MDIAKDELRAVFKSLDEHRTGDVRIADFVNSLTIFKMQSKEPWTMLMLMKCHILQIEQKVKTSKKAIMAKLDTHSALLAAVHARLDPERAQPNQNVSPDGAHHTNTCLLEGQSSGQAVLRIGGVGAGGIAGEWAPIPNPPLRIAHCRQWAAHLNPDASLVLPNLLTSLPHLAVNTPRRGASTPPCSVKPCVADCSDVVSKHFCGPDCIVDIPTNKVSQSAVPVLAHHVPICDDV